MSNELLFVNQRYFQQRLSSVAAMNKASSGDSSGPGSFDIDTGVLACFLDSIGIKKLPEDFATMIEIFFSSSFAKIFTFGLNTFPTSDWKVLVGAMNELGILGAINIEHQGIGNYIHLQSGLVNFNRRH